MNGLRWNAGTLRKAATTLAHRIGVAVSLIVLVVGVALAGTMLPWAVGQLAPVKVPLAALASNDDIAVSEAVTRTTGAAVLRATGHGGE